MRKNKDRRVGTVWGSRLSPSHLHTHSVGEQNRERERENWNEMKLNEIEGIL